MAWAAEHQGIPSDTEGAHFKREWFKHWFHTSAAGEVFQFLDPGGKFHQARSCPIIVTVDPPASEKKAADRTGIGLFAAAPDSASSGHHPGAVGD
jgi:hypothetical protein